MRSSASVACRSTSAVSCSASSSSTRDQRCSPKHRARYKRSQAATDFPSRRVGYVRGVFQVVKDCITNTSRVVENHVRKVKCLSRPVFVTRQMCRIRAALASCPACRRRF
jgi:hypothetical protein